MCVHVMKSLLMVWPHCRGNLPRCPQAHKPLLETGGQKRLLASAARGAAENAEAVEPQPHPACLGPAERVTVETVPPSPSGSSATRQSRSASSGAAANPRGGERARPGADSNC